MEDDYTCREACSHGYESCCRDDCVKSKKFGFEYKVEALDEPDPYSYDDYFQPSCFLTREVRNMTIHLKFNYFCQAKDWLNGDKANPERWSITFTKSREFIARSMEGVDFDTWKMCKEIAPEIQVTVLADTWMNGALINNPSLAEFPKELIDLIADYAK